MKTQISCSFGSCLGILVLNCLLGAWSFSYVLWDITGKSVPWFVNVLCGLVGGEVIVPLALIFWVLSFFGIHGPWVH